MGLLDKREERAALFISMRTLLDGVAETERCKLADAAGEILFHLSGAETLPLKFIWQDQQTFLTYKADSKIMEKLN